MRKLNKKLMGIFLSISMIATFSAVANAQIKTVELNVVDGSNGEVSEGAKVLALSAIYDKFVEQKGLKDQNLVNKNEFTTAGKLALFKNEDGKVKLYHDYSDKDKKEVSSTKELEKSIDNGEINKIVLEKKDIEKSKDRAINQMKQNLKNVKEFVENEDAQKKSGIDKESVEFRKNTYIPDIEQKIKDTKNIKPEEVEKAQKYIKIVDLKDVTKETEEHSKKIMSKEDYEKMKKAEEEFEKSLVSNNDRNSRAR